MHMVYSSTTTSPTHLSEKKAMLNSYYRWLARARADSCTVRARSYSICNGDIRNTSNIHSELVLVCMASVLS